MKALKELKADNSESYSLGKSRHEFFQADKEMEITSVMACLALTAHLFSKRLKTNLCEVLPSSMHSCMRGPYSHR